MKIDWAAVRRVLIGEKYQPSVDIMDDCQYIKELESRCDRAIKKITRLEIEVAELTAVVSIGNILLRDEK